MCDDALLDLGLAAAAAAIESGGLDPVELTEAYLHRIAATEPDLNAYVTVDAVGARAAARRAREEVAAGRYRGALHGIPVGVKDLFGTAGLRTTYGSIRYAEHIPAGDAVVVAGLRSAGAVILGKQATHEFAWGGRTDNPHFGPTHNPHDLTRIPGGSSGGGAASVVARSCLLALGSDTAGSVRIPASMCGCVGFKPVGGWIDMAGAFPLSPGLDTAGLMARDVADVALAFGALSGQAIRPAGRLPRRVGLIVGESAAVLDAEVAAAMAVARAALDAAGVEVIEVHLHDVDRRVAAVFKVVKSDAEAVHGPTFRADPRSYGADLAALLDTAPVSVEKLAAARVVIDTAVSELRQAFGVADVLVSATEPIVAPPIGQLEVDLAGRTWPIEEILTRLTSIANAAGCPAISVPAPSVPAPGERALPVGVQILAPPGGEGAMFALASALCAAAQR